MIARASCQLDAAGLPYPRTCPECGFGPCMKRHSDVTGDRQWEKWVSMKHEKAITELRVIIALGPCRKDPRDRGESLQETISKVDADIARLSTRRAALQAEQVEWNAQAACYHDAIKALESA